LYGFLSSMMKSHTFLAHSTWDVNHPLVQYILAVYATHATLPSLSTCFSS
jgi:hypothetical protein